jgi:hypothetical protein
VHDVKIVSQPDTKALLEIDNSLQIIETGFAEQDGACTNLFEIFCEYRLKQDLSNDTTDHKVLMCH